MAKVAGRMTPGHSDLVHDMKLNFYGDLIATCSSDKLVKIFGVDRDLATGATTFFHVQDLHAHSGPVWAVCWAFPIFGNIVASCGYDKKVIVWQEIAKDTDREASATGLAPTAAKNSNNKSWMPIYEHVANSGVNCIAFAPYDFLKITLAAGCVDGSVLVFECKDTTSSRDAGGSAPHYGSSFGSTAGAEFADSAGVLDTGWTVREITQAHQLSINCLNWADPYFMTDQVYLQQQQIVDESSIDVGPTDVSHKIRPAEPALGLQAYGVRRLVTGGSDNWIKLWREDLQPDTFVQEMRFQGHQSAVRDVAWRPSRLRAGGCFASASEDRYVFVWYHNGTDPVTQWGCFWLPQFDDIAWSVSFHPGGRILGVFHGKSSVSLFVSQDPDGSRWSPANEVYNNIPRSLSPSAHMGRNDESLMKTNQLLPVPFPHQHQRQRSDVKNNEVLNESLRLTGSNKQRTSKPQGRASMPAGTSRVDLNATALNVGKGGISNKHGEQAMDKLVGKKQSAHRVLAAAAVDDEEDRNLQSILPSAVSTNNKPSANPVIRQRTAASSNRPK